jgi:putative hydrolase of the HAD superfamily
MFDGLVLSGEINIVKPNAEIFEYLLSKYNLNREECIFVDDNKANITGAEKAGIKGYLFDGDAEKLHTAIAEI